MKEKGKAWMGSNSLQRTASTRSTPPTFLSAFDLFSSIFQPPPVWCRWLWDMHFWSKAKVNTQLQEKVRKSLQQRDDGTAWGFKDAPCLPYGWGSHQISAVFASQPFWLCLISHQFQIRAIRRLLLIRLKASPLRPKWLREKGEGTVDASHILSKQCPHTPRGSIFGCTKMTRLPGGINAGLAAIYRLSDPTGDMQADKHNTDAL